MAPHILTREQLVPGPLDLTFGFFAEARNLEKITPPWLRFKIISAPAQLSAGSEIIYRINLHGMSMEWKTEISSWHPPFEFTDSQKSGPYRLWRHTHSFEARGSETLVCDRVEYVLPFGFLGDLAHRWVKKDLDRIFDYRTRQTAALLDAQRRAKYP